MPKRIAIDPTGSKEITKTIEKMKNKKELVKTFYCFYIFYFLLEYCSPIIGRFVAMAFNKSKVGTILPKVPQNSQNKSCCSKKVIDQNLRITDQLVC